MTSKVHNHLPRINPFDLGKIAKTSPSLTKAALGKFSLFQEEKKSSCCQCLVDCVKRIFEKFVSFLRCIFCCKCPDKKKESTSDKTESKTIIDLRSTTTTKSTLSNQTEPKPDTQPGSTTPANPDSKKKEEGKVKPQDKPAHSQTSPIVQKTEKTEETTNASVKTLENLNKQMLISKPASATTTTPEPKKKEEAKVKPQEKPAQSQTASIVQKPPKIEEKKVSLPDQSKQKPILKPASTTTAKPELKNKPIPDVKPQEKPAQSQSTTIVQKAPEAKKPIVTKKDNAPIPTEESTQNESYGDFERIHKYVRGIVGEYLNHSDSLKLATCYPDMAEKMFNDLVKEIENAEELSTQDLLYFLDMLEQFSQIFSGPIDKKSRCETLLKYCKNLKKFKVEHIPNDLFVAKHAEHLKNIILHLPPSVTSINFEYYYNLRDEGLEIIAKKCPQLRAINLTKCHRITIAGLRTLIAKCKNLQELNLSETNIDDEGLQTLTANCKKLKKLVLEGCPITADGMRAIAANCKELEELDLDRCYDIRAGIQAIAENCKKLKKLSLLSRDIGDEELQFLANCKELRELGITHSRISFAAFQQLVRNCPQLTRVNLSSSEVIDIQGQPIATNCEHLKELFLRNSTYPTTDEDDEELQALVANFRQLEVLDLSGQLITDAGLRAVSENCTQLRELELLWCKNITDEGFKALAACKHLKKIALNKRDFNEGRVKAIRALLPGVKIEILSI